MNKEVIISESRDFKGIWIPKELYLNKELSWNEKILLIEIDSLSKCGECYANNQHFADFLGLSKKRVETIISELRKKGYITSELTYKKGKKEVDKRILKVVDDRFYSNNTSPHKQGEGTPENEDRPTLKNEDIPTLENEGEKNTLYKNTYYKNISKEYNNKDNIERTAWSDGTQEPVVLYDIEWKWESEQAYSDYINKQLPKMLRNISKNYSGDNSYNVLLRIFKNYYNDYRYFINKRHPWYKEETLQGVINDLFKFFDNIIDVNTVKEYAELFFQKNYRGHEMKVFSSYNTLCWLRAELEDSYYDVPFKEDLPFE